MRLILHIGTEKTGTTSFQHFCDQNREALLRQGLLYPDNLGNRNHRFVSIYALSFESNDDGVRGCGIKTQEGMEAFRRKVETRLAAQCRVLPEPRICLLSSEHLHSRLHSPDQIKLLRALLKPLFEDIEVYVHLRPQVEVAVSLASTQARVGGSVRRGFFDQVTPRKIYYDYDRLVGMWEEVFGASNVTCVPFKAQPDFLAWLAPLIGLDMTGLPTPARVNEALDVRVMAMTNALVESGTSQRIDFRVLDQLPVEQKLTLGRAFAEQIHARFVPGNQSLVARRTDLDPGQLQPDWSRYEEEGTINLLDTMCPFAGSLAALVEHYNKEIARLKDRK